MDTKPVNANNYTGFHRHCSDPSCIQPVVSSLPRVLYDQPTRLFSKKNRGIRNCDVSVIEGKISPSILLLKTRTELWGFAVETCGLYLPSRSNLRSISCTKREINRYFRYLQLQFTNIWISRFHFFADIQGYRTCLSILSLVTQFKETAARRVKKTRLKYSSIKRLVVKKSALFRGDKSPLFSERKYTPYFMILEEGIKWLSSTRAFRIFTTFRRRHWLILRSRETFPISTVLYCENLLSDQKIINIFFSKKNKLIS